MRLPPTIATRIRSTEQDVNATRSVSVVNRPLGRGLSRRFADPCRRESRPDDIAGRGSDFEFGEGPADVETGMPAERAVDQGIPARRATKPELGDRSVEPRTPWPVGRESGGEDDPISEEYPLVALDAETNPSIRHAIRRVHFSDFDGELVAGDGATQLSANFTRNRAAVTGGRDHLAPLFEISFPGESIDMRAVGPGRIGIEFMLADPMAHEQGDRAGRFSRQRERGLHRAEPTSDDDQT